MEETAQQLADHFGLSRYTIYKWTQRGILPPPHGYGRWARYGPEHRRLIERYRELVTDRMTGECFAERRQTVGIRP